MIQQKFAKTARSIKKHEASLKKKEIAAFAAKELQRLNSEVDSPIGKWKPPPKVRHHE